MRDNYSDLRGEYKSQPVLEQLIRDLPLWKARQLALIKGKRPPNKIKRHPLFYANQKPIKKIVEKPIIKHKKKHLTNKKKKYYS